ncbi:MAG TPA: hypothetical protein VNL35_23190 [Chloroflexota bacterium]|nr:hypothetical protein [Chloroflexota bacterium]
MGGLAPDPGAGSPLAVQTPSSANAGTTRGAIENWLIGTEVGVVDRTGEAALQDAEAAHAATGLTGARVDESA